MHPFKIQESLTPTLTSKVSTISLAFFFSLKRKIRSEYMQVMETTDSSGGPPPQPNLPPGFRFHPTDEELVIHYLKRKADSSPLPVAIIADVDLYKHDPWELPGKLNQNQTGQIRIVFFCFFPDHFSLCLSKFLQRRLCSENKSGTSSVHVIGNIQTELDRTELLLPVIGKRPVQINR